MNDLVMWLGAAAALVLLIVLLRWRAPGAFRRGDRIRIVGSDQTYRITKVSGTTITVDRPLGAVTANSILHDRRLEPGSQ